MDTRSIPSQSDISFATTAPRVTPTPPRAARFGEVLSNTVVRSAESAMRSLPGSPVMAVAVRSATATGSVGVPMTNAASPTQSGAPEGPIASSGALTATAPGSAGLPALPTSGAPAEGGNIESSLQQTQDMNLYYLQVQEAVNAQNRSFSTLSNVLKAQHDTVKTAIGNIR